MPLPTLTRESSRDKWVLIVGGGLAEVPLIRAAHAAGYLVATTGNRPDDPGHGISDRYLRADFSDREAVLACAMELGIEGIVSGCNDFAALTAAYVAQNLGLKGHDPYEVALRIHHKDRFREMLEECELPHPRSIVLNKRELEVKDLELNFPVIVKPVDLTGGKGMTVCSSSIEVEAAVAFAWSQTRAETIVIEEYLYGSNHGYTCFIRSERVVFEFADNEQYYRNPFLVSGTTAPSRLSSESITEIRNQVEMLSKTLHLVDGLVHVQLVETAMGPFIIEVCRRCPGDLYPYFVSLSTCIDYASAVVAFEVGADCSIGFRLPERFIARHCVMAARNGELDRLEISARLQGRIVDAVNWWQSGDLISNHLVQKLAIYFLEYDSEEQLSEESKLLTELFIVRMTDSEVPDVE